MLFTRGDESRLTDWFFEIDRRLLFAVLALMGIGIWAMVSAGSVAAERMNPPQPWHFFIAKAIPFYLLGLIALFLFSGLSKKWVLRLGFAGAILCGVLLLITLFMPATIKGSHRWISLFGMSIMPADLLKPGFIIVTAWFLDRLGRISGSDIFFSKRVWKWDGWPIYLAFFLPMIGIILSHPDIGTAALYIGVFAIMLFLAGLPMYFIPIFGAIGLSIATFAFFTMSHFRTRIISFLPWISQSGGSDNYQIRKSLEAIQNGGLTGSGVDSFIKASLPDAHTDFVFSAIVEDSGAIAACALLLGFLYILRLLARNAAQAKDRFIFYAVGGLFALFGAQSCINLLSALGLFPPKGMTLPFISYGGSSMLAFCALFGMIIAIVREDKWGR
jgi:cell division protein FtsW